jgi:tetratricopeptide (TPR) repeat protein
MKSITTVSILLFASLKLSASVFKSDTMNFSASVLISPNKRLSSVVFATEREMLWLTLHLDDSINLDKSGHPDSIKAKMAAPSRENSKTSLSIIRPDSLVSPVLAKGLKNIRHQIKSYKIDTLKALAKSATTDTLKALLYTEIADRYLKYDTLSDKKKQLNYQSEAINYTVKALYRYSAYHDTVGLRISFDNLAKIYFSQKKYSQAKWFILQSNFLARAKNDVPNIIASLLTLSSIKSEIEDYKLAMNDLDEALQLSITNHYPKIELDVLKDYALLYSRIQNYPEEELMLKKRDSLEHSIRKKEDSVLLAKVALQDSIRKKKADSLQNKKKAYTSNTRKLYKNNSSRKMASL